MNKMIRQKYLRGTRVKIADDLGKTMQHFPKGKEAIVLHTYSEAYGGSRKTAVRDYSLLLLDKNGAGERTCSWYNEHQLDILSNNRDKGEEIIQRYLCHQG